MPRGKKKPRLGQDNSLKACNQQGWGTSPTLEACPFHHGATGEGFAQNWSSANYLLVYVDLISFLGMPTGFTWGRRRHWKSGKGGRDEGLQV